MRSGWGAGKGRVGAEICSKKLRSRHSHVNCSPSLSSWSPRRENIAPDYPLTLLEGLTTIAHYCLLEDKKVSESGITQHSIASFLCSSHVPSNESLIAAVSHSFSNTRQSWNDQGHWQTIMLSQGTCWGPYTDAQPIMTMYTKALKDWGVVHNSCKSFVFWKKVWLIDVVDAALP